MTKFLFIVNLLLLLHAQPTEKNSITWDNNFAELKTLYDGTFDDIPTQIQADVLSRNKFRPHFQFKGWNISQHR